MNQWSFFPLLRLLCLVSAFIGIFTASHYYVKCGLPVCKKTFSLKYIVCTIFIIYYWKRKYHPTPGFLAGEFHGQRNLAGYSPWVRIRHD